MTERTFDDVRGRDRVTVSPVVDTYRRATAAGGRVWVETVVEMGGGEMRHQKIALSAADARAMGEHLIALAESAGA